MRDPMRNPALRRHDATQGSERRRGAARKFRANSGSPFREFAHSANTKIILSRAARIINANPLFGFAVVIIPILREYQGAVFDPCPNDLIGNVV